MLDVFVLFVVCAVPMAALLYVPSVVLVFFAMEPRRATCKCEHCGYSLVGLPTGDVCPECGMVTREKPERFKDLRLSSSWRLVWRPGSLGLAGVAAACGAMLVVCMYGAVYLRVLTGANRSALLVADRWVFEGTTWLVSVYGMLCVAAISARVFHASLERAMRATLTVGIVACLVIGSWLFVEADSRFALEEIVGLLGAWVLPGGIVTWVCLVGVGTPGSGKRSPRAARNREPGEDGEGGQRGEGGEPPTLPP